ncbi:hypothetical protein, partial [Acinetobacter tjernbergiae]|uniref:hypothetical protein n=1 Tax=Acinetobacter tjernbergiae TaxID=202955 RepID=UPI001C3F1DC4
PKWEHEDFRFIRMVDRADTYIQHFFLKQTYQPPEPRQTTRSHTSTGMGFFYAQNFKQLYRGHHHD